MTSGHFIFIPLVALAGMMLGFLLGTRAARDRFDFEMQREKEREISRAARAERKERKKKQAASEKAPPAPSDDDD